MTQSPSGIWCAETGSEQLDAMAKLATLPLARVLVLADIHHRVDIAADIFERYASGCAAAVLCGDCGEAFSELCFTSPNLFPAVTAVVRGNCDGPSVAIPSGRFVLPLSLVLTIAGKRIFITHGHLLNIAESDDMIYESCMRNDSTVALHGHIHVPINRVTAGVRIVCPGSPSAPRGGSAPGFAILEISNIKDTISVQFFPI